MVKADALLSALGTQICFSNREIEKETCFIDKQGFLQKEPIALKRRISYPMHYC
jgi:hypothetical protein